MLNYVLENAAKLTCIILAVGTAQFNSPWTRNFILLRWLQVWSSSYIRAM